ncbi:carbohydrate ABC transporter permease [Jeotgalicoccus halotolerans]|uniref:Carbohydrate ABC transporter membrane protein 2 (CUT1 family) n=1 Tax=Jeotgalicoccus halotolerans TaxID=157227 RepID=A0A3E0AYV9_9STAP|nr:carbohydrate ABC transporter permease [Jeotgalicoccus halotolerans]REG24924.1 carbohydrate ABC transporter membrane protein 2 (CUT1 family) [Jeotgalicoccus halotolerans]
MYDSKNMKFWRGFNFLLLIAGSLFMMAPLFWMLSISLKSMDEIYRGEFSFIPDDIQFSNFIEIFNVIPFGTYFLNTSVITVIVVLANVFVNAFIAYGFAKIKFKGRKALFIIVLSTMMLPGFVTLIPQYVIFAKIGLVNTYYPLIIPHLLGSAFNIFLLRQFFKGVPDTYIEAAKLEGANHFQIFFKIALPMVKPALFTVAIFSFNGVWNDFLGPLLYLNDESLYTLQLGLQVFQEQSTTQWNYLMVGSLLILAPVIILFFFFQKYFIQGSNILGDREEK